MKLGNSYLKNTIFKQLIILYIFSTCILDHKWIPYISTLETHQETNWKMYILQEWRSSLVANSSH